MTGTLRIIVVALKFVVVLGLVVPLEGCLSLSGQVRRGPLCEVHGVPLEVGLAEVRLGYPTVDSGRLGRGITNWPNANIMLFDETTADRTRVVAYCPKCRSMALDRSIKTGDGAPVENDPALKFTTLQVEVLVVQFSNTVAGVQTCSEGETPETLLGLAKAGAGSILFSSRATMHSGSEAEFSCVKEVRFVSSGMRGVGP